MHGKWHNLRGGVLERFCITAELLNFCNNSFVARCIGLYTSHFISTPSIITENLQRVCAVHLTWETTEQAELHYGVCIMGIFRNADSVFFFSIPKRNFLFFSRGFLDCLRGESKNLCYELFYKILWKV